MRKLEPAFVAVPSPLIWTLTLEGLSKEVGYLEEGLSKGVEYLEENLVGKATDWGARRQLMIIGANLTLGKQLRKFGTHEML